MDVLLFIIYSTSLEGKLAPRRREMKNVLLVAGRSESYYYLPFVTACRGKSICIHVLEMDNYPKYSILNVSLGKGGIVNGFIEVRRFIDGGVEENFRLNIKDIHIAWYLREAAFERSKDEGLETRFAENEARVALRSLLSVLDCAWVNRQETLDLLKSNKLYQQLVAERVGFCTPRTLVSNDPSEVVRFSKDENGLLLKTIGYMRLDEKGETFLYSQRFEHDEIASSGPAIRSCPVYAQEYVKKRYEYRVMVIGKQVLTCRIDSQSCDSTKVDWRHYDFERVAHTCAELPVSIQQRLVEFMQKIGLRYGALDLIETPEGEFVFLEVNPSGQWGWIADLAGLSVPEAVAEMLGSF